MARSHSPRGQFGYLIYWAPSLGLDTLTQGNTLLFVTCKQWFLYPCPCLIPRVTMEWVSKVMKKSSDHIQHGFVAYASKIQEKTSHG
jgi:hypothetical protein